MVIGQNGKTDDIELNVCKTKHLTNTRSSSADEALRLTPPKILSLEQALDFIDTDELWIVTPKTLRIRKNPGFKDAEKYDEINYENLMKFEEFTEFKTIYYIH